MADFNALINGTQPVLVDFSAEWCGPCKTMKPILEELAGRVKDEARILKVDVDKNPQAAQVYNVRSVPTLILFRAGKIIWRQSGVTGAAELERVIRSAGH